MQYAVIFKDKIKQLDTDYLATAQQMREKALTQFHCQHFESLTEGITEIALSYWSSLQDIHAWHQDAEH